MAKRRPGCASDISSGLLVVARGLWLWAAKVTGLIIGLVVLALGFVFWSGRE